MIPTKPGDPVSFETYRGQEALKRRFILRLNARQEGESIKALLFSPAGQGKTSFVRVLAYEMFKRNMVKHYFETIAGKFETKNDLDSFLRRIPANSIIFIDEIHGLPGTVRDALYPAIQDNIYMFNYDVNFRKLPEGLHWIGATTDLGKVHAAMRRRLLPIPLEPLSLEDKKWIALLQPRKVEEKAADLMAERSWSPWEIKDELYPTAGDIATEKGSWVIRLEDVLDACGLLRIDQNGLREKERLVLELLYKSPRKLKGEIVYTLSKNALVVMAGLDEASFVDSIEPKLMRLGYLTVSSVGRRLTAKAIKDYFNDEQNTGYFEANETGGEITPPNI